MRLKPESFAFTVMLAAMSALPPLAIDMALPGIPAIEQTYPEAVDQGALTLSIFLIGFSITPLFAGMLADRFGRKPVMLWGLALFSLAAMGAAMAWSFDVLLTWRLIQGIAAGICVILPLAIVRDLFEGPAAKIRLSQIVSVIGIAPMAAPLAGGGLMAISNWHTIFAAQAIGGILILLFAWWGMDESLAPNNRRPLRPTQFFLSYRDVLGHRLFRSYTAIYSLGFGCLFAYIASSPTVFIERFGLSEQTFSVMFSIGSAGVMIGSSIGGYLSKREVSTHRVLIFGLVGMNAASLIALGLAVTGHISAWTLMPLIVMIVVCFGMYGPIATHESIDPLPHVAGAASGMGRCIQMVIAALASASIAWLLPFAPAELVMTWVMAICSLLAAGAFVLHLSRVRQAETIVKPCQSHG